MARELSDLPDHQRCTSNNAAGGRCGRLRITGLDKCQTHANPSAVKKARVAKIVAKYGTGEVEESHPGAHPLSGVALELRRTQANIEAIRQQLSELTEDQLVFGTVSLTLRSRVVPDETIDELVELGLLQRSAIPTTETERVTVSQAALNVWVQLYLAERKHYLEVAKLALSAGFAERRMRMLEGAAAEMNAVIKALLVLAGLDPSARDVRAMVVQAYDDAGAGSAAVGDIIDAELVDDEDEELI